MWRQIGHWITSSIHENSKLKPGENMLCIDRTIFVHNMFSPCFAKRRASDKDFPVQTWLQLILNFAHTFFKLSNPNDISLVIGRGLLGIHRFFSLYSHTSESNSFVFSIPNHPFGYWQHAPLLQNGAAVKLLQLKSCGELLSWNKMWFFCWLGLEAFFLLGAVLKLRKHLGVLSWSAKCLFY